MKISSALLFTFLLSVISLSLFPQSQPGISKTLRIAEFEKKAYMAKKNSKSNISVGTNYDVKYHRFNWYIDPNELYIQGSVTTYFSTTKDTVHNISFELHHALTIDSIRRNGFNLSFNHTNDNVVYIELGEQLPLHTLDSVTIFYKGEPPQDTANFGSFVAERHGPTFAEPVLWTLSEPYGARDWWPCKQSLNDKIDSIDIFITTPKHYKAAANGILVSQTPVNGTDMVYHWKHRYPIAAYLIGIAVTNYTVYSDWVPLGNGKQLEILNYVYPEDYDRVKIETANTVEFMQLYSRLFSPYPFIKEKYGHAQFNWKGGMEHQTMTFVGTEAFDFEVIAHELAHQWYGDAVTTNDWHDLWLNEGFATYITGLCYQYIDPGNIYWPYWKSASIDYITSKPDGSVYVSDTANQDRLFSARLTYYKGAFFLHTIRWVIGDTAFFNGLRNYLLDGKNYFAYGSNSSLKYHLEQESNMDLTWLFDDWYYGEGYPTYKINVQVFDAGSYGVTLDQTTSANISFFKLPVPIRFEGDGKDTTIVFNNTFSGQTFHVQLDFLINSVTFDPENWLIAHSSYTITGIDDNASLASHINISPNPASDKCYINSSGLNISNISMADITGKILRTEKAKELNSTGQISLDLSELSKGIYFVRITTDKGVINKKITRL